MASWSLVGLLVVVMKISIRRQGCGGLGKALAKPWRKPCGELTEEAQVRVLHGLARGNPELIAQQDSQAFVRRERLSHIAARRECAHQKQISGLSERGRVDKLAPGTLRTRQLTPPIPEQALA